MSVAANSQPVEKIAVIGIGCRLPPNANSLAAFWRFLRRGGNALRPIKKDRWDWRQYFDADPHRPGKSYAPKAASLDADVTQFDPLAFGISPREAASLDPQQRLLLEVTWEAFEDAGLPLEKAAGSATGVFIGGFCLDHLILSMQPANRLLANGHTPGGVMMTVLSNRISHAFDLRGPSLTLDTACSSSLVSIHYACQSLRQRECDQALAGGANVMMRPDFPIMMSKGHFLSPHGECRAFDETAAGYARGEGAGVFLLKRLEDALAAGDPIHAVIRGTAVNQDGHTDGISLPSSKAQEALVREVYRRAGVAPGEVDYVEAHGTGTQAGDPAELGALHRTFAGDRARKLLVGSVKTNVGHLEAAAGVAGMLKAIGVLKHREVPANLHFKRPNPKIPFGEYCLEVVRQATALPGPDEKPTLYVGVNSFGYGGTNAHVVLESAPPVAAPVAPASTGEPRLVPISARSEEALRDLAGKFAFQLGQAGAGTFEDFAYTAAFRRSHLPVRAAVIARNAEELRARLIAVSTGEPNEGVATTAKGEPARSLAFVYTGMGPQWWGMGQELFRREPVAAAALEEIDEIFRPLAGWSLREAMLAPEAESRMAHTELAQPANFALQVALTRLWEARGVRPAAVVGHSVGEVASAYVAGVYPLEAAVRVSFHRSRLQQTMAGRGAMLAVGLAEAEALRLIAGQPGVSIAAVNSFHAVTLSGDVEPLRAIAAQLEARGVFQKFLRVEVAYHSPQMDPLREELLAALADLDLRPARIPIYSTAHGRIVPDEAWTAEIWWHNVRQPVRFAAAMQAMFADGHAAFLEVGPHPVLGNSIKECAAHFERRVATFASLRRAEPECARLQFTLAELYAAGAALDWTALAPTAARFLPGPQYPWQRQRHWLEAERSRVERLGLPGPVYLNRSVPGPRPAWEVEVNRNYFPFLFDHGVQNQTVFAGMGYVEAALAVSAAVHGRAAVVLESVSFERVLVVDYARIQVLRTECDPESGRFEISSRVEGEEEAASRQCRGRLRPQTAPVAPQIDLAAWRADCPSEVGLEPFYEDLQTRGLHYGPAFRPTTEVRLGDNRFLIRIDAEAARGEEDHPLHPTLFDAAIQPVLFCSRAGKLFVPFSIDEFHYFSRPDAGEVFAVGQLRRQTDTAVVADVWLTDAAGRVHAHARGMCCQVIETENRVAPVEMFYDLSWKTAAAPEPADAPDGNEILIVAAENSALGGDLAAAMPGALIATADAGRRRVIFVADAPGQIFADAGEAQNERWIDLLRDLAASHADGEVDVTLVTRDAQPVGPVPAGHVAGYGLAAIGLVAQNEFDAIRVRAIDLPATPHPEDAARVVAEIVAGTRGEIAWRRDERFARSLTHYRPAQTTDAIVRRSLDEPLVLAAGAKGRIDQLRFVPAERRAPVAGEVEVRVLAVGLNREDVLKIEGRAQTASRAGFFEAGPGMELVGEIVRAGEGSAFGIGERVVALAADVFRTYATLPETFVRPLPAVLGLEAAAIPVAFLVAWRGLVELAALGARERVLVQHATGGVGVAAIDVALSRGAEVFATAGTEEKRRWLREQGVAHVFDSRALDFAEQVRAATDGEGVDVVIGAQSSAERRASLGLLRAGGRCVETARRELADDRDMPLEAFQRNLQFVSVDLHRLAADRPDLVGVAWDRVLAAFAGGALSLRAAQAFAATGVREAFHAVAEENRVGKVWVDLSSGEVEVALSPAVAPLARADGTYVITGGTSGFGLVTARWLAEQGAGRLVLASRSGPKAAGVAEVVGELEARGTEVEVVAADVADPAQAAALLARAAGRPDRPLRGVVHGAMVLADALMTDLTSENFRRVFGPKARGAANLVAALPEGNALDFLVFYSSISSVIGNRGQASYVAANAFLDGLAHRLRAQGVPALSINWGALAEVGVVARDKRLGALLATGGITGLTNEQALTALGLALRSAKAQLGAFLVDWPTWLEAHPKLADDPRFRELRARGGGPANDAAARIRAELAEATREQRRQALEAHLSAVLGATLKLAPEAIPPAQKLSELGVDSLMVLELSLGIEERIGARFSAMEFLKGPTVQQLAATAVGKLWPDSD